MAISEHPAYRAEKMHLDETLQVIFRENRRPGGRLDAEGALSNARMYDPDALPIREMLYARAVQNEKNLSAAEKRPYFTRIDFTETGKQSQTYYIGKYGVLKSDTLIKSGDRLACAGGESVLFRADRPPEIHRPRRRGGRRADPEAPVRHRGQPADLHFRYGHRGSGQISEGRIEPDHRRPAEGDHHHHSGGTELRDSLSAGEKSGGAGGGRSGKTTIALHRIAYLLYTYQKRLQPENMLILAPSPLFLNFISQVLPNLGVESVRQTTFPRFVQQILGPACPKTADSSGGIHQMLSLPAQELEARSRVMRYKGSTEFMRRLEKWLDDYEARFPLEEGLKFGPVVLYTPEELRKFLLEDEKPFPLRRRLEELKKQLKLRVKGAVHQLCDWYARECDRRILALPKTVADKAERTVRAKSCTRACWNVRRRSKNGARPSPLRP